MADVTTNITAIRESVFGKDVRDNIADGIDAINAEVNVISNQFNNIVEDSGNNNIEIVAARTNENGDSFDTLGGRLNDHDSQIADKANIESVSAVSNQIANIIAQSGTSSTEVVDLRTGVDGTVYTTAKMRADTEMGKLTGIALPLNQNKNEGTATPTILPAFTESSTDPSITFVDNTDTPMTGEMPKKRIIAKTTTSGSSLTQYQIMPSLAAKPAIISFGYWIKDSDVASVFNPSTLLMEYWIYSGGKYIDFKFDIASLIASNGNTVTVTKTTPGAGLIDSFDCEAKCLLKSKGYSFVRITLSNIVWNSGFSDYANIRIYHIYSSVKSTLVGQQLTMQNFILLYNALINNPTYVYGDGANISQYPPADGIQGIVSNNTNDIATINNELVALKCVNINVTIDNAQTDNDVAIRTSFNSAKDLVQFLKVFKTDSTNNIVNLKGSSLIANTTVSPYGSGTVMQDTADDACPVQLSPSYIGANHGQNNLMVVTANSHSKTCNDISSEWLDSLGHKWYLLKVVDTNTLWFLSENIATPPIFDFYTSLSGTLTHSSGAINTSSITVGSAVRSQLCPATTNQTKKILLDGITEVSASGTYTATNYVDVANEYDVINPSSIVSYLISNKPVGGYTTNPALNVGSILLHYSSIYRFLSDGTMLIISDLTNYINANINYWGITQESLPSLNPLGGGLYRYIPKALSRTYGSNTYEFRTPRDMSLAISDSIDLETAYWENPASPPDREIDLFRDGTGANKAGFAIGYLPVAYGLNSARKNNITNAWNIYTSKKSYPHLIDKGTPLVADTAIQGIAYRKIYDISSPSSQRSSMYTIPYNNKVYVFIDYHGVIDDYINLPKELMGKAINVLEKSSNVTVFGTIVTDRLRVKVSTATPMYGYAVLELS